MLTLKRDIAKNIDDSNLKFYLQVSSLPLAVALLITLAIIFYFKHLPPKLPLFYSLPWGEKQLATPSDFFIIPLSLGAVALVNLIIAWYLHPSQSFFKKVLLLVSWVITLTLTIGFIKIVTIFA